MPLTPFEQTANELMDSFKQELALLPEKLIQFLIKAKNKHLDVLCLPPLNEIPSHHSEMTKAVTDFRWLIHQLPKPLQLAFCAGDGIAKITQFDLANWAPPSQQLIDIMHIIADTELLDKATQYTELYRLHCLKMTTHPAKLMLEQHLLNIKQVNWGRVNSLMIVNPDNYPKLFKLLLCSANLKTLTHTLIAMKKNPTISEEVISQVQGRVQSLSRVFLKDNFFSREQDASKEWAREFSQPLSP